LFQAARLIELQDQASKSLETFRAQVLAETNPEKQALIQVKVDQVRFKKKYIYINDGRYPKLKCSTALNLAQF